MQEKNKQQQSNYYFNFINYAILVKFYNTIIALLGIELCHLMHTDRRSDTLKSDFTARLEKKFLYLSGYVFNLIYANDHHIAHKILSFFKKLLFLFFTKNMYSLNISA
jgi:hypothetical protein